MKITPQWLAGFLDGEGCITIAKYTNRKTARCSHFTPSVNIVNTDLPTLLAIQKVFGGTLHSKGKNKHINWKQGWALHWTGSNKVKTILEVIRPYVISKRDQVEFMLDVWLPRFSRTKKGRGIRVSDEEVANRLSLSNQLSLLKKRNYPNLDINTLN